MIRNREGNRKRPPAWDVNSGPTLFILEGHVRSLSGRKIVDSSGRWTTGSGQFQIVASSVLFVGSSGSSVVSVDL